MEAMEFEAKKLLMERLDKNLLDHASALSSDSSGPTILGVYTLQGLAEMHCYLKTVEMIRKGDGSKTRREMGDFIWTVGRNRKTHLPNTGNE